LMSLLCCAVNIGLFCLNYTLNNDPNPPHVSERTFHLTEFWTTFLYALVDAYALVTSPQNIGYHLLQHYLSQAPILLQRSGSPGPSVSHYNGYRILRNPGT
jgi:hypothetical protein